MSNEDKIESNQQRIIELNTLIKHWTNSNISSRKATADLVQKLLTNNQYKKVA